MEVNLLRRGQVSRAEGKGAEMVSQLKFGSEGVKKASFFQLPQKYINCE